MGFPCSLIKLQDTRLSTPFDNTRLLFPRWFCSLPSPLVLPNTWINGAFWISFSLSLSLFHLPLLFPLCHLNAAVKRGWMQRGQALYPRPDKSVEDAKIYMDSVKCKHAGMLGFFATRKQGSRARLFRWAACSWKKKEAREIYPR